MMMKDLVPERTDVWTDVMVPAREIRVRVPLDPDDEADLDGLHRVVTEYLSGCRFAGHAEVYLA
jgi:hypothetical protein